MIGMVEIGSNLQTAIVAISFFVLVATVCIVFIVTYYKGDRR